MSFEWTSENAREAKRLVALYPQAQSALLPLLHLAQKQNDGWLSRDAIEHIAGFLALSSLHVYGVVHFYSMFNTQPIGQNHIQVCTTVPCSLCQGDEVLKAFSQHLNIQVGQTTPDNMFTLTEVECLGACTQAVVVQINETYVESVSPEKVPDIIEKIRQKSL